MDQDAYDDLLRRLTALIVKIDERDEQMVAILEDLREFNREQVAINQRLETLLERAWRSSPNGHTD